MKKFVHFLTVGLQRLRRYVSPVFMMLLFASFTLWYIAKLNYTYTTSIDVRVRIEGESFDIPCVVEGKGTTLFGYVVSFTRRLTIPLSELDYTDVCEEQGRTGSRNCYVRRLNIDPESLQNAIAVRLSDINLRSIGAIPEVVLKVDKR